MNYDLSEASIATIKNWSRLSNDKIGSKLLSRANKRLSEKRFIPDEYVIYEGSIDIAYFCLDNGYSIEEILYSYILNLTNKVNNSYLGRELESWNINRIIKEILDLDISNYKGDILGGIYQSLMTEGEKNKKGSYYTPDSIVRESINNFFIDGYKVIDPCCGTGQYILNIDSSDPTNIWGCDLDLLAVKICRINLIIKYKDIDFIPNIYHKDTLLREDGFFDNNCNIIKDNYFDIVATNPPWGSKITRTYTGYKTQSGESFSYFIERGMELLKKGGILTYILPESILNVKVHEDIRGYLLDYNILSIYELGRVFSGVFTKVIRIDIKKENEDGLIDIYSNSKYKIEKKIFKNNKNYNFSIHVNNKDNDIFDKLYSHDSVFLNDNNSDWALGIVTGNNKLFVSSEKESDLYVPVYTGKEVDYFNLKKENKYLLLEPSKYQQMSKLDKYTNNCKLIYKFISNKPVFSIDYKGVFTLNSANIIIPKIDYPIKVICALFNSDLYKDLFQKKFNSIKLLKSHIQQFPLPIMNDDEYKVIEGYVDNILLGKSTKAELDEYIFNLLINTK